MRRIALVSVAAVALVSLVSWGQNPRPNPKVDPVVNDPALKLFATEPAKPEANDTPLQKLQKERYAEVWQELALGNKIVEGGMWDARDLGAINDNGMRLLISFLAMEPTREAKIEFLTNYIAFTRFIELIAKRRFEAGSLRKDFKHHSSYFRIDAEIQLLKAKEAK